MPNALPKSGPSSSNGTLMGLPLIIALISTVALSQVCCAGVVNTDYLEQIGDFEQSHLVRWFSSYSKTNYDFAANSIYVDPVDPTNPGIRAGYSLPVSNSEVGDGWIKSTKPSVDPWARAVFKISAGGLNGSNCQFIALKGETADKAGAGIEHHIDIDPSKAWALHPGDTITLKIDYLKMSDYSALPDGATVQYYMALDGVSSPKEIAPSPNPFTSSMTAVVPAGVKQVTVSVYLVTSGDTATKMPGIYVDGAHLYVQRAGQSSLEQRNVPVSPIRSVKTHNVFFHPSWTDTYAAARDYDTLSESDSEADSLSLLRRFNPRIQVFLYRSGATCLDMRNTAGHDRIFKEAPFSYLEAITSHANWLYPNGKNGYALGTGYSDRYELRITDPDYQRLWAKRVIEKAKTLGYDGIWIDDLSALTPNASDGITREAFEVQQFVHAVYPKLKAAGLKIIQNECAMHLDGSVDWAGNVGKLYSDPFWTPDAEHPASAGYSANSPNSVTDVIFQEWAFLMPRATENQYDKDHWLACLRDMDEIKRWNTALSPSGVPKLSDNEKRQLAMWVLGRNFSNDSAYGADGWINFGLCSYLLGQNDWTSVGFRVEGNAPGVNAVPYPDIDYSVTAQLGVPSGDQESYNGDPYCRYRRYKATTDGGLGGVVVVNGYTAVAKTYTVDADSEDPSGRFYPAGTKIMLKPHTGRMLITNAYQMDVRVSVSSDSPQQGQEVDIAVAYTNRGTAKAANVVVRAQVPAEMTYLAGSAEKTGGRYDSLYNTVSWVVPVLAVGESGSRTFKAKVR